MTRVEDPPTIYQRGRFTYQSNPHRQAIAMRGTPILICEHYLPSSFCQYTLSFSGLGAILWTTTLAHDLASRFVPVEHHISTPVIFLLFFRHRRRSLPSSTCPVLLCAPIQQFTRCCRFVLSIHLTVSGLQWWELGRAFAFVEMK
jgi:hypothetical protein